LARRGGLGGKLQGEAEKDGSRFRPGETKTNETQPAKIKKKTHRANPKKVERRNAWARGGGDAVWGEANGERVLA